jgi:hypothetical protein
MANNNDNTTMPSDWLGITKNELENASTPLGMLKTKPLSYFDALVRNYVGNGNLFQVNLGQFPQNFVVITGSSSKVRVIHNLFCANTDPGSDTAGTVVGLFGANKVAPFKSVSAASAVLALTPPPRRGGNKKDPEPLLPSLKQFADVESGEEFAGLVGDAEDLGIGTLSTYPNAHLIHPRVFVDIEGKREWEASHLGYKLISLYEGTGEEAEGEEGKESDDSSENDDVPEKLKEIYQLLIFLWATAKQYGTSVTLREVPEAGEVTSLCERKASTLTTGGAFAGGGSLLPPEVGHTLADSRRLAEAMVVNLNRSSEAYVKQISKDDSTKSSLSRMAPDQAGLFSLLSAENFNVEGTPKLNSFTAKLTESRDPMRAINMVRQETRRWGGTITEKALVQFLSSGYLAPDMNQEPDGLTSLAFVPHHERHRFENKSQAATDNMRAMFGEKTFDEDSIKRYAKKQFFLPNRIEDWSTQLVSTARFVDLLTCEYGIASEAYRTAQALYEENEQTFRAVFQADKLMGVKILHFLDRVFQEFATDLSKFAEEENPIQAASALLRGRQRNTVISTLGPLKYGVKPTIALPPGLIQGHGQRGGGTTDQGSSLADVNTSMGEGEGSESRAPSGGPRTLQVTLPQGWRIPRGRTFGDFFNPRTEANRANLAGWPSVNHDRSGVPKAVCVRLIVTGKCPKENCKHTHIQPSALDPTMKDSIATRLSEIYQQDR